MLIEPTLQEHIGPGCAGEGSQRELHATGSSHAKGSADGVGLLNVPSGGYPVFADCAFVMNGEQTSTKPFFRWPCSLICWRYVERFC
jgi:hypothetical protein